MTRLTQNVEDVTGSPDDDEWIFYADGVRLAPGGHQLISTTRVRVLPVNGFLTVDLVPGPAVVSFAGEVYRFTVPDYDSEIWPLISGDPAEPGEPTLTLTDDGTGEFIIGYGGIGLTLVYVGNGEYTIAVGGSATLADDGTGLFSVGGP